MKIRPLDTSSLLVPLLFPLLALLLGACAAPRDARTTGKLHHVGLVWLKEPGDAGQRQALIDAAHRFAREIPEVRALSVGQTLPSASPLVDGTFDVCFVMVLDDAAALERYGRHPVHEQAARELFLPLASKLLFYDFVAE
ncbi:MAG TPA: Dabb family protein [Planctomycetota bacterium]